MWGDYFILTNGTSVWECRGRMAFRAMDGLERGTRQDGNYNNVQPIYWKIGVPHRLRAGAAGKTYSAEAVAVKATAW